MRSHLCSFLKQAQKSHPWPSSERWVRQISGCVNTVVFCARFRISNAILKRSFNFPTSIETWELFCNLLKINLLYILYWNRSLKIALVCKIVLKSLTRKTAPWMTIPKYLFCEPLLSLKLPHPKNWWKIHSRSGRNGWKELATFRRSL